MINTGFLSDWADKQSPFIRLADKESFVGKYLAAEEKPNRFDPKQRIISYTLENKEGDIKMFDTGSLNVARQFDKIKVNTFVKITRSGEKNKTTYEVEAVVDETGQISQEDADFISKELAG